MSRIALVVRRVGGLEVLEGHIVHAVRVVRRVGGLEGCHPYLLRRGWVVRRVGGLEGLIEESFIMGFPFLTRRRWNGRDGRSRDAPL